MLQLCRVIVPQSWVSYSKTLTVSLVCCLTTSKAFPQITESSPTPARRRGQALRARICPYGT